MNAAALSAPARPDPRALQRCLLLAVLLHVWLVLVFGNAAGTAAPGQGVWGSLTVKLLGPSGGEPGAPRGDPAEAWRDNGAPGTGAQPRQGGQVRPAAPADAPPGAAELGRWNPRDVPPEAARTNDASPAPPSPATLKLPDGFRPIEREALSPPAQAPTPAPAADLPALPTVGRLEARPDAAVTPLLPARLRPASPPSELPSLPDDVPAPVRRLESAATAPGAPATLPRPADLRTAPAPAATATPSAELPPPVRRLEAPAAAVATTLPRPADLRAAPAPTTPAAPSAALPSTVQRLEAPAADGATVTPLPRPSELRAPAIATAAPAALTGVQDLPAPVRRLEAADGGAAVAPLQPAPSARASLPTLGATASAALNELAGPLPGHVSAPAGLARGDPSASPTAAARASAGSPNAGSRLGPDLAVPPSAAASAPRAPLNLSLPRSGDIAARRGPGLIDVLPQPPERKSKLEQSMEDAANADCRKAYANTGLLAVVPLAIDTARGKGCKW